MNALRKNNFLKILSLIFIIVTAGCSFDNDISGEIFSNGDTDSNSQYLTIELSTEFNRDEGSNYNIDSSLKLATFESFYDFDSDSAVASEAADIFLSVSCGSDCFNIPKIINNATVVWLGEMVPTYQQCLEKLDSEANIKILDAVPLHYSCLRTNSGNIVLIQVLENGGILIEEVSD